MIKIVGYITMAQVDKRFKKRMYDSNRKRQRTKQRPAGSDDNYGQEIDSTHLECISDTEVCSKMEEYAV